jgi:hypothetical protein
MSGYTAMAIAIGSAVAGAAAKANQARIANNNIARQNMLNQYAAHTAMERANYQAQISYDNAVIAQNEADAIRDLSLEEQRERLRQGKIQEGAVIAAAAASGFLVDPDGEDSSIYLALAEHAGQTRLDIRWMEHEADLRARAVEDKGLMHTRQGDLFMMEVASIPGGVLPSGGQSESFAAAGSLFASAGSVWAARPT